MAVVDVDGREALSVEISPYGSAGVVHSGPDLGAWWIWKDDEEVEPTQAVVDREDLLYIIKGSLRLELDSGESRVLHAGESFVIPAGMPFRGYRWPRDGGPWGGDGLRAKKGEHLIVEGRTLRERINSRLTRLGGRTAGRGHYPARPDWVSR